MKKREKRNVHAHPVHELAYKQKSIDIWIFLFSSGRGLARAVRRAVRTFLAVPITFFFYMPSVMIDSRLS